MAVMNARGGSDELIVSDLVNAMVQRLVERFAPDQVIFFGSHARGHRRPGF